MTVGDLEECFEKFSGEYLNFSRLEKKRANRPDLHVFLLMDELQPGSSDIVSTATHDKFFIGVDLRKLAAVITEEQVRELVWCGVHLDEESFAMFT